MITPEQIADAELIERDAYRAWVSNLTAGIPLQNAWSAAWSKVKEMKMRQKIEQQMTPTEWGFQEVVIEAPATDKSVLIASASCPKCGAAGNHKMVVRNAMSVGSESGMAGAIAVNVGSRCRHCDHEWGFVPL